MSQILSNPRNKPKQNWKFTKSEILKFNTVKKWVRRLKRNNKLNQRLSANSRNKVEYTLQMACTCFDINPDEIILQCMKNDRDSNLEMIIDLRNYIQDNTDCSLGSANGYAYGSFRGFMSANDIDTHGWKQPKIIPKVAQTDSRIELYTPDKKDPTILKFTGRPILQKFFKKMPLRNEFIGMALLSSSQDIGLLTKITINEWKAQKGKERFFWHGIRERTGEEFKTFMSKEATAKGWEYYESERKRVNGKYPLIGPLEYYTKRNSGWVKNKTKTPLINHIEGRPINTSTISDEFRRHYEDTFKVKIPLDEYNPFRPKGFRSIFESAATASRTPIVVTQCNMGHKGEVVKKYLKEGRGYLEGFYAALEPFVTVFPVDSSIDITEYLQLQNQLQDTNITVKELIEISKFSKQRLLDSQILQ